MIYRYIHNINFSYIQNYFNMLTDDNNIITISKFSMNTTITYVGFGQWLEFVDISNKFNLYKPSTPMTLRVFLELLSLPCSTIKDMLISLEAVHKQVIENEIRRQ